MSNTSVWDIAQLHFVDLPSDIRGVTSMDLKCGCIIILINKNMCPLQKCLSLGHELSHIALNHFVRSDLEWTSVPGMKFLQDDEVEAEADRLAWIFFQMYNRGIIKIAGEKL